ncbi:DUF362 domain-containing protein [Dysgonomonas sp. 521]|uniref:DUF362 domain-containing protein n=1 Tax=Dysgonomonas sp. 521 TaxID=2302932 RepID=UPI0013D1B5FC|nr:DUF362 domain-containing protein [Dysgonomonas sp. 521]NDV95549.1 DUF362 domain-containing protein [Dysgonomonas sp. 521]
MERRKFFKSLFLGGLGATVSPILKAAPSLVTEDIKPETNIKDALAIPRNASSMPGKYPGKVVRVNHSSVIVDGKPSEEIVYDMLKESMLQLTGETDLNKAWLQFVDEKDIIGLKVNPVAGKLLTTSHALTQAVVKQLEEAGILRENMVIWDRREMQLHETGYTEENYPGITITGTECEDAAGSYYNNEGKLYSEERIDKDHYLYADVEMEYDAYTMPFMVNGGKYSYFTKICTQKVTKIINLPVLKNAGSSVTLCMKNLAFGSITNTARLHKDLWHETSAYACAFPPLRDKVVLNIVDGLIGCFEGGPSANPQFICNYNTLLAGSDPVAVDRIGHDIVIAKRIEEGIQTEDKAGALKFMNMAQELNLGVANKDRINLTEINLA